MMNRKVTATLVALSMLSGCAGNMTKKVDENIEKAEQSAAKATDLAASALIADTSVVRRVPGAWLGNKPIPVASNMLLPDVFRQPYEFRFPSSGRVNIATFAERFTRITRIPTRISPDVYRNPAQQQSATTAQGTPGTPPAVAGLTGAQFGAALGASQADGGDPLNDIQMNFSGTPAALLDQLCSRLGISWEYRDGTVVLQRFVTRVFTIKTPPGTSTYTSASGRTGSGSGGSSTGGGATTSGTLSTGFSASSNISNTATLAAMDSIRDAVRSVLSPIGNVSVSHASGTLTVVDTIDGIERAAHIVERENEILTRSAKFRVEVLSLKNNDADAFGLDWNAIFNNVSGKLGMTLTSPPSLLSDSGRLGMQILTPAGAQKGRFDGTNAIAQALSEYGRVSNVFGIDVLTRNRRPTPVAITNQTSYLAQTTPASATSGGTGGAPGLTPGVVTTGLSLNLQPNILDSNQIALQFSLGVVDLVGINTVTSGSGANLQSIQVPETSGFEFTQDVFLKPGEMLVLTGYERTNSQYNNRSLAKNVPILLGGSFRGSANKERLVIIVTPTAVANAN